ncbi:MAG: N-acetylglucosamine kinase [Pedobacter sp.]|nr:MAG: N-acetylglucosamine kinase [Pedobacter sp.]
MLVVADGGSSITDRVLLSSDNEIISFESRGINPFFLSEKEILKVLNSIPVFQEQTEEIKEVHFFGAGCNSPDKRELVSNALSLKFTSAFVNVESDLLGTAFATCGNSPGLSCILGTGSNISYFDGNQLFEGLHGLGYIFDDEASGTYFGKKLITDYLYGKMPEELAGLFGAKYEVNKELVIKNIYQKSLPNFYLASHIQFLAEHIKHPYCHSIVEQSLDDYITTHVLAYDNYQSFRCHFVGPTAFYFKEILEQLCIKHQVNLGKIIEKPINDLFKYVREKEGF